MSSESKTSGTHVKRALLRQTNRMLRLVGLELLTIPSWDIAMEAASEVDVLVDVGAADGTPNFYSLNTSSQLLLIEPHLVYGDSIDRVLRSRSGRWVPCAVSNSQRMSIKLSHPVGRPVLASAKSRTARFAPSKRVEMVEFAAEVRTLDSVVDEHIPDPDQRLGIKIDVEGLELEVLEGAKSALTRADFLIVETSFSDRFVDGYSADELICFLRAEGFRVQNMLSARRTAGHFRFADLLFVKSEGRGAP